MKLGTFGPLARIIVRYVAGALVAKGLIDASTGKGIAADADLVWLVDAGLGFGIGAAMEGWYWLAKRYGWKT